MDFECLIKTLHERPGTTFLAPGRNRDVFISHSKLFVFKCPKNWDGYNDNEIEHRDYNKLNGGFHKREHLAKCRLSPSGILVMEFVEHYSESGLKYNDLPSWTDFIDCRQVGLNRTGKLVAFDWA